MDDEPVLIEWWLPLDGPYLHHVEALTRKLDRLIERQQIEMYLLGTRDAVGCRHSFFFLEGEGVTAKIEALA